MNVLLLETQAGSRAGTETFLINETLAIGFVVRLWSTCNLIRHRICLITEAQIKEDKKKGGLDSHRERERERPKSQPSPVPHPKHCLQAHLVYQNNHHRQQTQYQPIYLGVNLKGDRLGGGSGLMKAGTELYLLLVLVKCLATPSDITQLMHWDIEYVLCRNECSGLKRKTMACAFPAPLLPRLAASPLPRLSKLVFFFLSLTPFFLPLSHIKERWEGFILRVTESCFFTAPSADVGEVCGEKCWV